MLQSKGNLYFHANIMTGTAIENQRTPEIKTPEELINRLESKSQKTLADKVRSIEQTVTDGTESKWKKLQAELPDAEKQQIETILKDENPEVGTRLKMAPDDSQEKMNQALKTG